MNTITDPKDFGTAKDTILILGNGFDISLGRKTKYSDFCDSILWPFDSEYENKMGLGNHLYQRKAIKYPIDRWIDLEEELFKYCKEGESRLKQFESLYSKLDKRTLLENDREDYDLLCDHLSEYFKGVQEDFIDTESPAARVISKLSGRIERIFCFNYTNLKKLEERIPNLPKFEDQQSIVYIHGKVDDNTAILGIDDQQEINRDYRFMVKQFNKNFFRVNVNKESNSLDKALRVEGQNIVFFGCSFGENDIDYFKSFFNDLETIRPNSITVFTYDDESRMSILDTLAKIKENGNGHSVKYLSLYNDFQIITTKDNGAEIDRYLNKLDNE